MLAFCLVALLAAPAPSRAAVGEDWTLRTTPSETYWFGVTYGNGTFVAVKGIATGSDAYQAMTSTNGVAWTRHATPVVGNWRSVAYGNGLFVAVSYNNISAPQQIMTSPDGVTWTPRTTPAAKSWYSVTYGNGRFVAVAGTDGGGLITNRTMTSTNGIDWTAGDPAANLDWQSVTYGNGLFVAGEVSCLYQGVLDVLHSNCRSTWAGKTCCGYSHGGAS